MADGAALPGPCAARESLNPVPGRTIGEHGVIGNLATAALVAADGTIDFMCWPNLDSPTVFAGLLDPAEGGEFTLAPAGEDWRSLQLYAPDTNVLLTQWLGVEGSAEIVDLMPYPSGDPGAEIRCSVIRRVAATRGRIRFTLRCRPRPDYARIVPTAGASEGGVTFCVDGEAMLRLWATVPLTPGEGEAVADFTLERGEEALLVLDGAGADLPDADSLNQIILDTKAAWRHWAAQSTYRGRWREAVMRSALALKLLTSHRHGSIAAAATFGLPEASGAGRNWDYRAIWIRDASFTVYALMRLGYRSEADHFGKWVSERMGSAAPGGKIRVMYALDGSPAAEESELGHLAGYAASRPVRIGNAARQQRQLDIYGELLDSVYLFNRYGSAVSHEGWSNIRALVEHVCRNWRAADDGIWELRDGGAPMLHSRLMCWVAIDRSARLASKRSLVAPLAHWLEERDRIAEDIWTNFRHPERGFFVQRQGGTKVDAALLMMPLVRFVAATDPVWLATLDAIHAELGDGALIHRYRNTDGLEGGEGAFTACTFWFAECLARAGRLDEARLAMERGMRLANHLGLFSEEADERGLPLGNFPQALTHLSFISAAYFLDRRLSNTDGGEWQP